MSEKTTVGRELEADPEALLAAFAANVRAFDELTAQMQELLALRESSNATLGHLDTEISAEDQPAELSHEALSLVILEKRIAEIEDALRLLASGNLGELGRAYDLRFKGRKARVASLYPEERRVQTFLKTGVGLDYVGHQSHEARKGRVSKINLHPEEGGSILLKGAGGKVHKASPLIDRAKDYAPVFSIELI